MSEFEDYANKYDSVKMRRENGILEMTFHTDGGSLRWSKKAHQDLEQAFLDVGRDRGNEIVIITGTGPEYAGPAVQPTGDGGHHDPREPVTAEEWDQLWYWEGKHMLMNLLNIEVPMIAAINGPAVRHPEIPLLCDIVLASERATIQDSAHFNGGLVPGDGVHIVFPLIMGPNRGRYFLLTGQVLNAQESKDVGLVSEVLPHDDLLPRAWELALQLQKRPPLLRRYARVMLTQDLKQRMQELLGYGLALEGLAAVQRVESPGTGVPKNPFGH
ncbi:MAG: enoyl-CoA hydratase/isomerase family protein [Hoeflea sp.]|uniref:enoyl-CoA hydratase/isomerase family protein n=1 Tax=Hoeflea sp. TaxID=1940281 RepID=UPI001D9B8007|nr:enoyl-CoA hydratase/isomerase family protein [Hoeflea sp.]MBU4528988.1 enoyl-CoA hydratase/isomerase family protein [Alphaproteobacteria bacterium]MBU4543393.1 enoyl-CoA hydratase/isomerase family protein [Alphaproteobacteria bacterium]MBU4549018.1 enoyl-CoA hydratase/isomerase family protein [Alphaproteobacteria bacterium]MBV1725153.1 enoyl-CoA hydratase/isomerase family protein [Hoeflea sp.]MBV1785114.1 enoyl-CoA hydratase/isomerase family protein [Hoeflea sp.]